MKEIRKVYNKALKAIEEQKMHTFLGYFRELNQVIADKELEIEAAQEKLTSVIKILHK